MLWNLYFDPLLKEFNSATGEEHDLMTLQLAFADDLTVVATSYLDPEAAVKELEKKLRIINDFLSERKNANV